MPGSKGTTRDVRRPWKIGKANSKTRPHMVRWVVAGNVLTQTFATFALADGFRSDLIQAMSRGEALPSDRCPEHLAVFGLQPLRGTGSVGTVPCLLQQLVVIPTQLDQVSLAIWTSAQLGG